MSDTAARHGAATASDNRHERVLIRDTPQEQKTDQAYLAQSVSRFAPLVGRRDMTGSITAEFLALQELLAGRYSIERELGRGGMGIVLLARDVALDRPVAIKLLPPHLATRPDERERFLQEARTAAGLAHPNIVPIHLVEAR